MVRCSAPNCKNNSSKSKRDDEGHQITYHMFPHGRPSLCKKWVELLKEVGKDPNWFPSAHSKLCCVHFEKKYVIRSLSQTELTSDAVPTIFTPSKSKANCVESHPCTSINTNSLSFETGEDQQTSLPQLVQELYILNLLTEAQGSNNSSFLAKIDNEPSLMPSSENQNKSLPPEQTTQPGEKTGGKNETISSYLGDDRVSTSNISNHGRLTFNPVELAIEIPEESTHEPTNLSNTHDEHVLCIAGSTRPNGGKVVSLHKHDPRIVVLHDVPQEGGHGEECGGDLDATETTQTMVVGGTKPFVADEGMNRDHDYCGSLVDIVAKIKKHKLSPENELEDKDSKKQDKDSDIYSKIAMSDLLEALAQYELADIFSVPCPDDTPPTEEGDVELEYTQQEAVALADHFDASVANFFTLEKADAAMPRLEAMIDSFMYYYGLTEADLGYVLHGSPASGEAVSSDESEVQSEGSQTEVTPPLVVEEPEAMEHDGEEEMEVLSNVVMVDTPAGGTHLMDLTTILEQPDLEQFIDTLNI